MKLNYVFVYGTLLSGGSRPASSFVDATVEFTGTVPGCIYDLGWFPGFKPVDISDFGDDLPLVKGEIISVTDEGLERLDAYEGCPDLYYREMIMAMTEEGHFIPVNIYVYNGTVHEDDVIQGGDWIAYEKEQKEAA